MDSRTLAGRGTVLAVGVIAAIQSYSHIFDLAHTHGEAMIDARLMPLSVDGLIVAASLALVDGRAPRLARWVLALGVTATIAANVAYGLPQGALAALISAWPGISFVAAAELLLRGKVHRTQPAPAIPIPEGIPTAEPEGIPLPVPPAIPSPVPQDVPVPAVGIPSDVPPPALEVQPTRTRVPLHTRVAAAQAHFATDLTDGRVPGIAAIRAHAGGSQKTAYDIQRELRKLAAA